MSEAKRGERLQIMLMKTEIEALDDWRFQRQMPSRAAAIRELLKRGLKAEGFLTADRETKSGAFGVVAGSASSIPTNGNGKSFALRSKA
jgi:hypothetical protein